MYKFNVSLSKGIVWPQKCAYCCEQAESLATSKNVEATAFYGVAYKERETTIKFPVCKKHRMQSWLMNFFSRFGAVRGFVALIFLPLILSIPLCMLFQRVTGLEGPALWVYTKPLIAMLYFAMYAAVTYIYIKNPVKLLKNDGLILTIRIKNPEYAQEFEQING